MRLGMVRCDPLAIRLKTVHSCVTIFKGSNERESVSVMQESKAHGHAHFITSLDGMNPSLQRQLVDVDL